MENSRLFVRNPLLRIALEHQTNTKFHRDKIHENFDIQNWYECKLEELPEDMKLLFLSFELDEDTSAFLDLSYEKCDWLFTELWYSMAKSFLSWFACPTTINGWLGRGSMFVFSENQFLSLIGQSDTWSGDHLLDLGAGDGEVTQKMSRFFKETSTTEISWTMRNRLLAKGYNVLGITEWVENSTQYDVIACLNLLDRCDHPLQVLKDVRSHLKPTGLAIIALVLPYKPFVEWGSKQQKSQEVLPISGKSWEQQVTSFIQEVAPSAGFSVVKFSRLPYLCEGDASSPFYFLVDAVFVLKPA